MNLDPAIAKRRATYQDVLDAPEHMVAEIIDGDLHLQPRPRPRHAKATVALTGRLTGPFDLDGEPGGWVILIEPELHLGRNVLVPDLAGWRRTRMTAFPDAAWIDLAPDWVCEVLSPSTREYDLTRKRDIYGREGVGHLWFVDPEARTLEGFVLEAGRWVLDRALHGDEEVRLAPFDAIAFSLADLWV